MAFYCPSRWSSCKHHFPLEMSTSAMAQMGRHQEDEDTRRVRRIFAGRWKAKPGQSLLVPVEPQAQRAACVSGRRARFIPLSQARILERRILERRGVAKAQMRSHSRRFSSPPATSRDQATPLGAPSLIRQATWGGPGCQTWAHRGVHCFQDPLTETVLKSPSAPRTEGLHFAPPAQHTTNNRQIHESRQYMYPRHLGMLSERPNGFRTATKLNIQRAPNVGFRAPKR